MKIKPQQHLINILSSTKQHHPNFTLFLGAGASITSGVESAQGMIKGWREAYSSMHGMEELQQQAWYQKENEYSELFEALYDQPTQRREFIESCITEAKPSWGYVYLSNLLKMGHFNTIFTTNFDDLVNEACFTFSSNLRPIVCAHDSSITSVRLTTSRPKIIKLHGDFLFDNIKNTIRELESLEDNMRAKFRQFATEFGMIVIGYSGHDRSIMDTLNTLLHSGTCFPHGIYWCTRDDKENLSEQLKNLARFPHFHLIKIDGFDEFMADLHESLGCKLQQEVVEPYSALSNKLDRYFTPLEDNEDEQNIHSVILRDMHNLSDHVRQVNTISQFVKKIKQLLIKNNGNLDDGSIITSLELMLKETTIAGNGESVHFYNTPNFLIASSAFRAGDYLECIEYADKHLKNGPSVEAEILIIKSYLKLNNNDELQKSVERLSKYQKLKDNDVIKIISTVVELIDNKYYEHALKLNNGVKSKNKNLRYGYLISINDALCTKLTQSTLTQTQIHEIEEILNASIDIDDAWVALGAAILLDKDEIATEVVDALEDKELVTIINMRMPIFTLISQALHEKVVTILKSRGHDIHEFLPENSEDEDASENLSQNPVESSDEESKLESTSELVTAEGPLLVNDPSFEPSTVPPEERKPA